MEDKNGRSALSQGTVGTPTKVKATLASIPVATKSLVQRGISSMALCLLCWECVSGEFNIGERFYLHAVTPH